MTWVLVVWLLQPNETFGRHAFGGLTAVVGYADQGSCVVAGTSLPPEQFGFYCIPGPLGAKPRKGEQGNETK